MIATNQIVTGPMGQSDKVGIIALVLVGVVVLVGLFKLKAAVPLTLVSGYLTWTAYDTGDIDWVTCLFAGLTAAGIWAIVHFLGKGSSKSSGKSRAAAKA